MNNSYTIIVKSSQGGSSSKRAKEGWGMERGVPFTVEMNIEVTF